MNELRAPNFKKSGEVFKKIQQLIDDSYEEIFKDSSPREWGIEKELYATSLSISLLSPFFDKENPTDNILCNNIFDFIKAVKETSSAKEYIASEEKRQEQIDRWTDALEVLKNASISKEEKDGPL